MQEQYIKFQAFDAKIAQLGRGVTTRGLVLSLFVFLSAALGSLPAAADNGPAEITLSGDQALQLTTTKARYVRLPRDARDVLVADPSVAEIVMKTPRTAYLIGMQAGDTNAFFLDAQGNRILTLDIRVEKDLTALRKTLDELLPDADIEIRATNGDIVLSGLVPSAEAAENARLIARRFVDEDEAVINLLGVTSPEQVVIKVRVTEMRRSVAKRLGISLIGDDDPNVGLRGLDAFNTGGAVARSGVDSSNTFAVAAINGSIGGFQTFDALIEALEDDGYVKTLAEPNLTALSGEEANFLAGGEFPIPVSRDEEGRLSLEFKPFGVGLQFTPVVLGPNRINLHIATEVSALSNEGAILLDGLRIPALTVRRAETTVEIPSGGSLVLGGLLRNDAASQVRGVPGLSDIPILGTLFRSTDFQRDETELVVIAIPYVVRPMNPRAVSTPVDGFVAHSDLNQFLLRQLYSRYPGAASQDAVPAGAFGFIID